MEFKRSGSQASIKGSSENFIGNVRIEPLIPTTPPVTHIAIAEALDGKVVEWFQHVTDEEYAAGKGAE